LKIDMIDGDMTAEANGKVFGFNDRIWVHLVRKISLEPYKECLNWGGRTGTSEKSYSGTFFESTTDAEKF
jgi:hypothetical protein